MEPVEAAAVVVPAEKAVAPATEWRLVSPWSSKQWLSSAQLDSCADGVVPVECRKGERWHSRGTHAVRAAFLARVRVQLVVSPAPPHQLASLDISYRVECSSPVMTMIVVEIMNFLRMVEKPGVW